jgi:hypothetical protein
MARVRHGCGTGARYTPPVQPSRLEVPRDKLASGGQYNFTLTVSSTFLGTSASISRRVTVATVSLPRAAIDGDAARTVNAMQTLTLTAVGGAATTCAEAPPGQAAPSTPTGALRCLETIVQTVPRAGRVFRLCRVGCAVRVPSLWWAVGRGPCAVCWRALVAVSLLGAVSPFECESPPHLLCPSLRLRVPAPSCLRPRVQAPAPSSCR